MALSKYWTVYTAWREAFRDLEKEPTYAWINADKHWIANRAQLDVVSAFYGILNNEYMRSCVFTVADKTGKHANTSGTWKASTKTFSGFTLSSNLSNDDIGCLAMMIMSDNVYVCQIVSIISTSSAVVSGDNLPTSDGSPTYITIAGTNITGTTISLSQVPMMRSGQQIRSYLESSLLTQKNCNPVSLEELNALIINAPRNANKIFYALSGEIIYLRKPDAISSFGTLTFHYPSLPDWLSNDSDYFDVPDSAMGLVIARMKRILGQRINKVDIADTNELTNLIKEFYASSGVATKDEEILQKVEVLK